MVIQDDLTTPSEGFSRIRFFNLSPNAPALDLVMDGNPVFQGNTSGGVNPLFESKAAGTYTVTTYISGSVESATTAVDITLVEGKIYTVFATGFYGGTEEQALQINIIENN